MKKMTSLLTALILLSTSFAGILIVNECTEPVDASNESSFEYELIVHDSEDYATHSDFMFEVEDCGTEMTESAGGYVYTKNITGPSSTVYPGTDQYAGETISTISQFDTDDDGYLNVQYKFSALLLGAAGAVIQPYILINNVNLTNMSSDYYTASVDGAYRLMTISIPMSYFTTDNVVFDATFYLGSTTCAHLQFTITLLKCTVTFNSNGGSNVASQTVYCGETVSQPTAPTKTNNTFDGWYKESSCTNAVNFSTKITGNKTYYAKWTETNYTITYNGNGGTSSKLSETISVGTSISSLPTASLTGYELIGWFDAQTSGNQITTPYTPSGSITLYAHWKPVIDIGDQYVVVGAALTYADVVPSGNTMTTNVSWLTGSGTSLTGTVPSTVGDYSVTITSGEASKTVTFHVVTELVITNLPSNGMIVYAIG